MQSIATSLRTLQFVAHAGHNMAKGETFFADHKFLGDLYEAYEGEYDDVVERSVGEGIKISLFDVNLDSAKASKANYESVDSVLESLLKAEAKLRDEIKEAVPGASDGTQNLLQGISDASLKREYLISRRLE